MWPQHSLNSYMWLNAQVTSAFLFPARMCWPTQNPKRYVGIIQDLLCTRQETTHGKTSCKCCLESVATTVACGYSCLCFWSFLVPYLILVKMELFCNKEKHKLYFKLLQSTISTSYFCSYSAFIFYFINCVPISRGSMSEM